MSWSMLEPDDPLVCECRYEPARDEMDREDCFFHHDLIDEPTAADVRASERKQQSLETKRTVPRAS